MNVTRRIDEGDVFVNNSEHYREDWDAKRIPRHLDEGDVFVKTSSRKH